jgi:hypothetical protein
MCGDCHISTRPFRGEPSTLLALRPGAANAKASRDGLGSALEGETRFKHLLGRGPGPAGHSNHRPPFHGRLGGHIGGRCGAPGGRHNDHLIAQLLPTCRGDADFDPVCGASYAMILGSEAESVPSDMRRHRPVDGRRSGVPW